MSHITLEKLNTNVSYLQKEIELLRSLMIGLIGKEKEGRYNPQFVKKILRASQEKPFHQLLHAKSLTGSLAGFYSFRITRDWRVIFQFVNPQTIKLIEAAHRKDIYR